MFWIGFAIGLCVACCIFAIRACCFSCWCKRKPQDVKGDHEKNETDQVTQPLLPNNHGQYNTFDQDHHAINLENSLEMWKIAEENNDTIMKKINKMINFWQNSKPSQPSTSTRYQNQFRISGKFYTQISFISKGAFGEVYQVSSDGNQYALKIISNNDNNSLQYALDYERPSLERFRRLKDERVVELITSDLQDNTLYLVMELCDYNLDEFIRRRDILFQQFPFDNVNYSLCLYIFVEILKGLDYIHSRVPPTMHRDIKPSNIMIKIVKDEGVMVKIGDFGLAKLKIKSSGNTMGYGTAQYMAPELRETTNYNTMVDIYSLGVVARDLFSELLTKQGWQLNTLFKAMRNDSPGKRETAAVYLKKMTQPNNEYTKFTQKIGQNDYSTQFRDEVVNNEDYRAFYYIIIRPLNGAGHYFHQAR